MIHAAVRAPPLLTIPINLSESSTAFIASCVIPQCTVIKSTPSFASYIGTVPRGIFVLSLIAFLISCNFGPVLKSITASAPYFSSISSFSSSTLISSISVDDPIFALIFVCKSLPIPVGRVLLCTFFGITTFPEAIFFLNFSTSIFSVFATYSISGVISPFLAYSN